MVDDFGVFPGNKSWNSFTEGIEIPFRSENREHGKVKRGMNRPKKGHIQGLSSAVYFSGRVLNQSIGISLKQGGYGLYRIQTSTQKPEQLASEFPPQ